MTLHSSVPHWPQAPPPPDLTGRTYVVAAPADCPVADAWCAALSGRPLLRIEPPDLPSALEGASVGLRLLMSGPEHVVLHAAAQARE